MQVSPAPAWYELTLADLSAARVYNIEGNDPNTYHSLRCVEGWPGGLREVVVCAGGIYKLRIHDSINPGNSVRLYVGRFVDQQHYLNTLAGIEDLWK